MTPPLVLAYERVALTTTLMTCHYQKLAVLLIELKRISLQQNQSEAPKQSSLAKIYYKQIQNNLRKVFQAKLVKLLSGLVCCTGMLRP